MAAMPAAVTPSAPPPPLPKERQGEPWGRRKWRIAKLKHGGYGATCGYHTNVGEKKGCKKTFCRQGFSDEDCRVMMKQWLLAGLRIADASILGHDEHVGNVDLMKLPVATEESVDAEMALKTAGLPD
jgi:hypothetical protein